jgi:hypothetical protein
MESDATISDELLEAEELKQRRIIDAANKKRLYQASNLGPSKTATLSRKQYRYLMKTALTKGPRSKEAKLKTKLRSVEPTLSDESLEWADMILAELVPEIEEPSSSFEKDEEEQVEAEDDLSLVAAMEAMLELLQPKHLQEMMWNFDAAQLQAVMRKVFDPLNDGELQDKIKNLDEEQLRVVTQRYLERLDEQDLELDELQLRGLAKLLLTWIDEEQLRRIGADEFDDSSEQEHFNDAFDQLKSQIEAFKTYAEEGHSYRRPLSKIVMQQQQLEEETWQIILDKASNDLDLTPPERVSLLQQALRDPAFSGDVREVVDAFVKKGLIKGQPTAMEKLFPSGTQVRADLEGMTALRKQLPEVLMDLGKQLQDSPRSLFSLKAPSLPSDPIKVIQSLQKLTAEDQDNIVEEFKDLFRSTPKGLETPSYEVKRVIDGPQGIEIRAYEEFTVAQTSMSGTGFGLEGGSGFNTLAEYLFGKNQDNTKMAMTMPVETSSSASDSDGSMSFVLPKKYAEESPMPLEGSGVQVIKVPRRLVAVKTFAGIVTDQETKRQKTALLESLAADGVYEPIDTEQVSVLQYNSPATVPFRRRNEVAIVVTEKAAEDTPNEETAADALEGGGSSEDTAVKAAEAALVAALLDSDGGSLPEALEDSDNEEEAREAALASALLDSD